MIAAALVGLGLANSLEGQVVERPTKFTRILSGPAAGTDKPQGLLLPDFTVEVGSASPRARIEVGKMYALVFGKWIPFYFFTNLSALLPEGKDSAQFTAKELLSQFGGLANLSFAGQFNIDKHSVRGKKGLYGDIRGGAKLIELAGGGDQRKLTGAAEAALNFNWLIPLANADNIDNQVGLLTINVRGTGNVTGGKRYKALFETPAGKVPPNAVFALNIDGSFHLFNQFYVSAGYSLSSNKAIPSGGFFGASISRK
jgi:hypothetical protein